MPNQFWKFQNHVDGNAELLLYGDIAPEQSWWGDEVTPRQFAEDLAGLGAVGSITVRINSGGGDVFAAQAIGNLLEQQEVIVTARIDGVCASAAIIITCHCNKAIAANDSTYMVHPVRMYCGYANEADLQKYLETLATIKENIISLYAKKTGHTKDEVTAWMDAESWWAGSQAKENGFVDELTDEETGATYENRGGVLFVNSVSMRAKFGKTPEFVRNRVKRVVDNQSAGQPEKQREVQGMDPKDSIKTADDLRKAFPTLVDQIEQAARTAAAEAATNAERQRIRELEDMALAGSEKLLAGAKYDKPMSAEDFARAIVKNAKTQGATYLAQVQKDAENSGVNGVANTPPTFEAGVGPVAKAVKVAAVDAEVMAARLAEIDRVRIISNIDGLDETVLDILARDFKVDWWDPEYSIDEKRRTLKGSWRVHKILGTKAAVETAIRAIYPLTTVEEWFEYGGDPYHFRLNIDITSDSGDRVRQRRVLERLNFYKSLRSHNDGVRYFLYPAKSWAVAGGGYVGSREVERAAIPVPPLKRPGSEVIILAGGKYVGSWSKNHATVRVPPLRRAGGKTTINAGGGFTGSYSKDHATVRVPHLQRAGGSAAVSPGGALRGMYRKINTAVAVPELVRPRGAANRAAAKGFVGSVERVTVKVNAGKIRVPTGRAATGGTAGMFHSYQRIRVSVGSPAMTISGR